MGEEHPLIIVSLYEVRGGIVQKDLMYNTEMDETLQVINKGLNKTTRPKQIIVVGAGMAGLVSTSLLKAAGHEVKVLKQTIV